MALLDDLVTQTSEIAKSQWTRRDGTVVPESKDLGLGNDAVDLEATILYADLADSTQLAIARQQIAAEVYKAYLMGTTKLIRALDGDVRSFDGDRVMGVFIGDHKNTTAAKVALQINHFFLRILKPAFEKQYPTFFPDHFALRQTVGIDTSKVMAVRAGIRNNNDLVWVGKAPNVAAKLSAIREDGYSSYITAAVFNKLNDTSKYGGNPRKVMWESRTWAAGTEFGTESIYRSNWTWTPK